MSRVKEHMAPEDYETTDAVQPAAGEGGLREALEVLKGYEALEADIIDSDWKGFALPRWTQDQWDELLRLQEARNSVLTGAASPVQEPTR